MCVRRERPKDCLAGPSPVAVDSHLRRLGPLRDIQNIPRQIAVRGRGGFLRDPPGGAAVILEKNKREQSGQVTDNRKLSRARADFWDVNRG
jgi:hypothetical protein